MHRPSRYLAAVVLFIGAALAAVPAPQAQATSSYSAAFFGDMRLIGPGLGYMCHSPTGPGGTSTIGTDPLSLCPGTGHPLPPACSELPFAPVPSCHLPLHHAVHVVGMFTSACLDGSLHVLKPTKLPADAGTCTLSLVGTLGGSCDLFTGRLSGYFQSNDVLSGRQQVFQLDVHLTALSYAPSEWTLTGHATKLTGGQPQVVGLAAGAGEFYPPTPVLTPGESCFNRTARTFVIGGRLTLATVAQPV